MNPQSHPTPIRIGLLLEHLLLRECLARLLASEPGFEVVAECASHREALEILNGSEVDVVLLDLKIGDDFISASRHAGYQGKFLIIASAIDAATSAMALGLGASGVFLGSESSARLIQAIRLVASGEAWVDRRLIQLLADRYPRLEDHRLRSASLTGRQQTVLQGVVDGLTNRKIGDRLGVSEGTIKATLQQLFVKAGVRTRSQLVRAALEGSLCVGDTAASPQSCS